MGQQFSPGLLYSVAPENLSTLHLQDEESVDAFEWEQPESQIASLIQSLLSCFRHTAKH